MRKARNTILLLKHEKKRDILISFVIESCDVFSNVYYISLGWSKAQHIKNVLAKTIAFMSIFLSLTMQQASI